MGVLGRRGSLAGTLCGLCGVFTRLPMRRLKRDSASASGSLSLGSLGGSAMASPPTRFRASRTPRGQQTVTHRSAVKRHARQVGEIIFAWNWLQVWLFKLFWILVDPDNHALAYGTWHTIQSDSTQREMVRAAARARLNIKGKRYLLNHVLWILKQADMLATFRNDRAHAAMLFGGFSSLKPDTISTRKQVLDRLQTEPPEKQWRRVRDDLWGLGYFTNSVAMEIWKPSPMRLPLPRRPRILTKPVAVPPPPQPPRQRKRKRSKPPPPPFRG